MCLRIFSFEIFLQWGRILYKHHIFLILFRKRSITFQFNWVWQSAADAVGPETEEQPLYQRNWSVLVVQKSPSLKKLFERKNSQTHNCCLGVNLHTVKISEQSDEFPMSFVQHKDEFPVSYLRRKFPLSKYGEAYQTNVDKHALSQSLQVPKDMIVATWASIIENFTDLQLPISYSPILLLCGLLNQGKARESIPSPRRAKQCWEGLAISKENLKARPTRRKFWRDNFSC